MAILTNRVDAKQKENRKIGWQSPPPPEKNSTKRQRNKKYERQIKRHER